MQKITKGIIVYWYSPNGNKIKKLASEKSIRLNNIIDMAIY
jgi:hypothetical protein